MPDYATASKTKGRLLRDYPEIVSIAPRLKLDDPGQATSEAVIVIGVKRINPIRFGPGAASRPQAAAIPVKLPAITFQGTEDQSQCIEIIIEDEGEIVLDTDPRPSSTRTQ